MNPQIFILFLVLILTNYARHAGASLHFAVRFPIWTHWVAITFAVAINNAARVVGYSQTTHKPRRQRSYGLNNRFVPVEWAPPGMISGASAADGWGYAHAINARAQGAAEDCGKEFSAARQAFLSEANGVANDLPCLPGQSSVAAKAVNKLGVAAGVSEAPVSGRTGMSLTRILSSLTTAAGYSLRQQALTTVARSAVMAFFTEESVRFSSGHSQSKVV